MRKILILATLPVFMITSLVAQSTYQLAFKFANRNDFVSYKAFFINYGDGSGLLRLKFNAPENNDNTLLEMKMNEVLSDSVSSCSNHDRIFYKLQKTRIFNGNDNGLDLPQYICLTIDKNTGLFEPSGVSNSSDECKSEITSFSSVEFIELKKLIKDVALQYFKPEEEFYKNLFYGTKTRDLTLNPGNIKMYLIVVANIFDDSIGQACLKDMNRAVKFFTDLKDFLGLQFEYTTISGANYGKASLETALDKLNPTSNDIVVFYYSGHGFRQDGDTRRPPYIDLRPNYNIRAGVDNSMSMADIFDAISRKGARLNLVLSDCCNSRINNYSAIAAPPARTKGFGMNWSTENCRKLFLNASRNSILATAAEPGQLATCNPTFGGFFSYYLLNALENNFSFFKSDANVSWDKVLTETKTNTKYKANHTRCALPKNPDNTCYQIPYTETK